MKSPKNVRTREVALNIKYTLMMESRINGQNPDHK